MRGLRNMILAVLCAAPACKCGKAQAVNSVQASLTAAPPKLDFGDVPVGTRRDLALTLANATTVEAHVTSAIIQPGGSPAFTAKLASFLVAAGGAVNATVSFAPTAQGPASATLEIDSDAAATPQLLIPLTGNGTAFARIEVSPAAIDFGDVLIDTTQTQTVTVRDDGTAPLNISSIQLAPDSAPDFHVQPPAALRVQPGQSETFTVSFAPTQAEKATGTVLIASDDAQTPVAKVALTGQCEPRIVVSPAAIDFGQVSKGGQDTKMIDIKNIGTAPLHFSAALSITSSPDFQLGGGTQQVAVPPKGQATVAVTFTPQDTSAAGVSTDTGEVDITDDDPATPSVAVPINGSCGCHAPPAYPCDDQYPTRIWPDAADALTDPALGGPACDDSKGFAHPAVGPNSADWFNYPVNPYPCGSWKDFAVTPGQRVKITARDESCGGCMLVTIGYYVQEKDASGTWQNVMTDQPASQPLGYQDAQYYRPTSAEIRIQTIGQDGFHVGVCMPAN